MHTGRIDYDQRRKMEFLQRQQQSPHQTFFSIFPDNYDELLAQGVSGVRVCVRLNRERHTHFLLAHTVSIISSFSFVLNVAPQSTRFSIPISLPFSPRVCYI